MQLSKCGFRAQEVMAMSSVELNAWLKSYWESLGIKAEESNEAVSARIPLAEIKKRFS